MRYATPKNPTEPKMTEATSFIRKTLHLLFCAFHAFSACGKQKSKLLKSTAYLAKAIPCTFHILF